jgi:hypothetical protein
MAGPTGVAEALIEYDPRLAEHVLRVLAQELGVEVDGWDADRIGAALAQAAVDAGSRKSTIEWKAGFAHVERLRSLALELSRLLHENYAKLLAENDAQS